MNLSRKGTYGFKFTGLQQERVAGIVSVGWENRKEATYDWDGLKRDQAHIIIFQYTLKGRGEIKIDETIHRLEEGSAFLVNVPGNHRYYLPASSDEWEFVHLTLIGEEALACYKTITKEKGHVLTLPATSRPIKRIIDILQRVDSDQLTDSYEASSLAYTFLMELERHVLFSHDKKEWPKSITKAIHYIDHHFSSDLTLDDIVDVSGQSKYHFTRLFREYVYSTPIQYLTKRRISESIKLLKNEDLTIDQIALKVGFSNGNYFIKVFRSLIGVPPGEYRDSSSFISVDHIILD